VKIGLEEEQVEKLGNGLAMVCKDNPQFLLSILDHNNKRN
jgi:hypothetical protein